MAHRDCTGCGLHKVASRLVFASGDPDGGVVFVGEGPGPTEDRTGRPFDGRAGATLDGMLAEAGFDRDGVYVTNVVKCFPNVDGKIRAPADDEMSECTKRYLFAELEAIRPQVLVLLGRTAVKAVAGNDAQLSALRGQILETRFCRYTLATYHPSYVARNAHDKSVRRAVVADFKRARTLIDTAKEVDKPKPEGEGSWQGQLEQRIIEASEWRPDRKYFGGYSDGTDPILLYRDPETGEKRRERIEGFKWYFYMRTDDVMKVPESYWAKWRSKGVLKGFALDDVTPDWTRLYAHRAVQQTQWLKDRGEIGVVLNVLFGWEGAWASSKSFGTIGSRAGNGQQDPSKGWEQRREKFQADKDLGEFLEGIHKWGPTFEADLTPRQRFMTDRFVHVEEQYNELFFDFETDDTEAGFEGKEERRVLSFAAVLKRTDGTRRRAVVAIRDETDASERAMFRAFSDEFLRHADILYAWNGFNFDFPILRAKMRAHRIDVDWRLFTWTDLLAVWRRYHTRGASTITTFALGELAPKVLKQEKLDWRVEAAKTGKPVSKIIELYRTHPDILKRYNMRDADLLHDLEENFGYAGVERVFCRLGNCFANDLHISTKVDMLLLNKGRSRGSHFVTRGLQHAVLPEYVKGLTSAETRKIGDEGEIETRGKRGEGVSYIGGYVKDPAIGYHEGVAALDFKSLYPTVMTLFNISPDSWVDRDAQKTWDGPELSSTPSGAFFKKKQDGLIPLVFRETMEKRKVYSRLQLAEPVGSDRFLLYYRLSYAYKRLGLSFYGELGNLASRYFNPEVAEAVTLAGQWFMKKTIEFAESKGYAALYGDTDSLFIQMTPDQAQAFVKECDAYYREIVKPFNVDMSRFMMELEYENYFRAIVFVKKKRYAGKMTIFKGKESDVLEVKGLEMMRSDGIELGRRMQREALELILGKRRPPKSDVVKLLTRYRDEIFGLRVPLEDVTVTQSIEKDVDKYKTKPPHVRVAEHIKKTTAEYFVGMKVPYIVTEEHPKVIAVWAREADKYDPYYVWNKKTYPLTHRILDAVYQGEDWSNLYVERPKPPKKVKEPKKKAPRKRETQKAKAS